MLATFDLVVLVISWMTLPALAGALGRTPPRLLRNPFHANMTIVVGTLTIFLVGLLVSRFRSPPLPGEASDLTPSHSTPR